VRRAKGSGAHLTVETCHHYLTLNAEAVPDRAMQYKCCPPVRSLQNRVNLKLNLYNYNTLFLIKSPSIARIMKSSRLLWGGCVDKTWEARYGFRILMGKSPEKKVHSGGRKTLRKVLQRQTVRIGGGWYWLGSHPKVGFGISSNEPDKFCCSSVSYNYSLIPYRSILSIYQSSYIMYFHLI
jgi:hypothetical protein